jgi:hypothetical protein
MEKWIECTLDVLHCCIHTLLIFRPCFALLCFASLGSRELKERVRSFWFQRKEGFDMSFIGSYVTEDAGRTMYSIPFSSPRESEEASMYLEIL